MQNAMAERRRKAAVSPGNLNGFRNQYWLNQARQYGFNTAKEVMDFQRQNSLTADGMIGANTIRALRERNNRQRTPVERPAQRPRNPREYEYSTPNGTTRPSSVTGYRGLDLSNEFFNNTGIVIPNTEDIVVTAPDLKNRITPYIPAGAKPNKNGYYETKDRFGMTTYVPEN